MAGGIASLRANDRLRKIGWVTLAWSVFGGAAVGIMPAVLREHMGMDEIRASATFIAATIAVVSLTLPLVRILQARVGALSTFVGATVVQGGAVIALGDARVAVVAPALYCVFLLTNSTAAASLGGARAAAVDHAHQGLLNLFARHARPGRLPVWRHPRGGPARPARVRRRPRAPRNRDGRDGARRSAGRSPPPSRARPPPPPRHRLPGRRAAVRGRRRRARGHDRARDNEPRGSQSRPHARSWTGGG